MNKEKKTVVLSWNTMVKIITNAVEIIKKNGVPDVIVAIQRGGLIPAVILSHALDVRDIIPLDIRVTIDDSVNSPKMQPIIKQNLDVQKIKGKNVLFVDDIIGSGLTYRTTISYLSEYHPNSIKSLICVINKTNWEKDNDDPPEKYIDFIGKEVRGWVEFPWERKRNNAIK